MAINTALGIQQDATNRALDTLGNTFNQSRTDLQPYRDMGQAGLVGLGQYANKVNNIDFDSIQNDPIYQFERDQAQEMGRRQLSAQGMLGSSTAPTRLAEIGMQSARGGVDRALNRTNMINQNNMGLATLGQNAATNLANAGAQYSRGYGDLLTGMANAQASGILSDNAFNQKQDADNNKMWMGLAGSALGNADKIVDGVGAVGSFLKGLGDADAWWS